MTDSTTDFTYRCKCEGGHDDLDGHANVISLPAGFAGTLLVREAETTFGLLEPSLDAAADGVEVIDVAMIRFTTADHKVKILAIDVTEALTFAGDLLTWALGIYDEEKEKADV
jgi:hypothetical protein